jgi:GH18 family chitinase
MDADQINTKDFTVIHFAFGYINDDFTVSAKGVEEQFEKFKKLTDVKKIISFGGWAFSNDAPTNHIMRLAVKPANAPTFADNIYNFVMDNDLDGVDFDWEYPGATDIEGGDPGTPEDGPNYLNLLTMVKRRFQSSKTVAIAAPASYWYLRNFPIKDISKVVDYIVYMTYDLHGQWDVNNKWSMDGCEAGDCLRSHVNSTLTERALALITKAGVPQYKVIVGVSSYGRSFKMAEMGCDGPDCTFLGTRNESEAAPGVCTGTAGYISDAEIDEIKAMADADVMGSYYEYHDDASDSDIIVYNDVEWVAHMNAQTKQARKQKYADMTMGGTSDWAIDLAKDYGGSSSDDSDGGFNWSQMDLSYDCHFETKYDNLDDLDKAAPSLPYECVALHAIDLLKRMLGSSLDGYDAAADGYDGLFDEYKDYMKKTLNGRLSDLMRESSRNEEPGAGTKYFKCFAAEGAYFSKREDAHEVDCTSLPLGVLQDWTYFYELQDAKGFNDTLADEGIDADWVVFDKEWTRTVDCSAGGPPGCLGTAYRYVGYPQEADNIDIPNPKDIVEEARGNMDTISDNYDLMTQEVGFDAWDGNLADIIDILSTPVFMLQDAVAQMVDIKEIGNKWKGKSLRPPPLLSLSSGRKLNWLRG